MKRRGLRVLAAAAVLAGALIISFRLAPVYWNAYRFRRHLAELAAQPGSAQWSDERIRAAVVNQAAQLGLPVRSDQVRVHRSPGGLRLEVSYVAPVRFSYYRVDLHFRPRVGAR